MNTELIFDFGNAFGKWNAPGDETTGMFRHTIAPLSETQWRQYAERNMTPPEGYIRVNGEAYVIGDAARRHTIKERPRGAARYTKEYYGVGLAYAMVSAFKRSVRPLTLFASHAPIDIDYARDLQAAARGTWIVEANGEEYRFDVREVLTFDEPLGGFNHYVLTVDGKSRKDNPVRNKTVLVCDVGGHTVDVGAIDPGGMIDIASFKSTRTGVLKVIEDFTRDFRSNNKTLLRDIQDITVDRIDLAIRTGIFRGGKLEINCQEEATAATQGLVNDIEQIINENGGFINYDCILLTGGGAALVMDRLSRQIPQIDFIPVEPDLSKLQYANVYGGAKLLKMLKRVGVL